MTLAPEVLGPVPRESFLADDWWYEPGQHVTILGPTGTGKTHLSYQLLGATASPKLPAVNMVMKPKDGTVAKWDRELGFRRVRTWPPGPLRWPPERPAGWTLWPRHSFDPEVDDPRLFVEFRKAILDSYKRGNRILFADEVAGLATELWLKRELVTVWARGRSMRCGLWACSQRPVDVPLHAYSQAEHLFLSNDPDVRAQQRYAEIGGVDPRLVVDSVRQLKRYPNRGSQWLYIRRVDRAMCVVDI